MHQDNLVLLFMSKSIKYFFIFNSKNKLEAATNLPTFPTIMAPCQCATRWCISRNYSSNPVLAVSLKGLKNV